MLLWPRLGPPLATTPYVAYFQWMTARFHAMNHVTRERQREDSVTA